MIFFIKHGKNRWNKINKSTSRRIHKIRSFKIVWNLNEARKFPKSIKCQQLKRHLSNKQTVSHANGRLTVAEFEDAEDNNKNADTWEKESHH